MALANKYDIVVVGAGLFGLTVAERCANDLGANVLLLDRRDHIGGNAYSYVDAETGIEVHMYGAHLFHTSNRLVWEYANRFTSFTGYSHKVYAVHGGEVYPLPINLGTINQFYRSAMTPAEAESRIRKQTELVQSHPADNLNDQGIRLIGQDLYEAFIKNYTSKQWQTDPSKLPASVIRRLPVRFNYDNRYFNDKYEGLPTDGYTAWFDRMIDSDHIELMLGVDFFDDRFEYCKDRVVGRVPVVYTGPIDEYFRYSLGRLSWRTVEFETSVLPVDDFQGTSVMNYVDLDVPYTRIIEPKHFYPERDVSVGKTVVMKEYSRFAGECDEPYYPINSADDRRMLEGYRQLASREKLVFFGGRLGTYAYLDMHMAIGSALSLFRNSLSDLLVPSDLD